MQRIDSPGHAAVARRAEPEPSLAPPASGSNADLQEAAVRLLQAVSNQQEQIRRLRSRLMK